MEDEQEWVNYFLTIKQIGSMRKRKEEHQRLIENINHQLSVTNELNEDFFNELNIVKLWKENLIEESHWFHIKDNLTDDLWCTNTNPIYKENSNFEFKSIDGKNMMRPISVGKLYGEIEQKINKIKKDIDV